MYLHKNYCCYVISSHPPANPCDDSDEDFQIFSPQPAYSVPMQYLHKNYVITNHDQQSTTTRRPYIGLSKSLALPSPTPSLLDEPLPLNFSTKILKPVRINDDVPKGNLIDIQHLVASPQCSWTDFGQEGSDMHVGLHAQPILDEKFSEEGLAPVMTPISSSKAQKSIDDTAEEVKQRAHSTQDLENLKPFADVHVRNTTRQQSNPSVDFCEQLDERPQQFIRQPDTSRKGSAATIISQLLALLVILFHHCSRSVSHVLSETPLCHVYAKRQVNYHIHRSLMPHVMNPHVPSIVLAWSLLPPDIHPVHPFSATYT